MGRPARIMTCLAALAVLAALCAQALPRGLADLRAFEVRMLFKSWNAQRRLPTAEEWTLAHDHIRDASGLDPRHPSYIEERGRLHELRALPRKAGNDPARDDLRKALDLRRQVARLRPGSPYTWSSIARIKSHLAEPDSELESALRHAALLGPWEPEIQIALADTGFRHWGTLASETRKVLNGNAMRALRHQDARLFELARRHGQLAVLCAVRGAERSRHANACI